MRKLIKTLLILAVLGILAWPGALLLEQVAGTEAVLLTGRHDETSAEVARLTFDADEFDGDPEGLREAVAELYGTAPSAALNRYLFVPAEHLIRPEELPGTALVVRSEDYYPVQARSIRWPAGMASMASVLAAAVLLLLGRRLTPRGDD